MPRPITFMNKNASFLPLAYPTTLHVESIKTSFGESVCTRDKAFFNNKDTELAIAQIVRPEKAFPFPNAMSV